ncbi:unnamed protein product [Caenorhabditis nigoni]
MDCLAPAPPGFRIPLHFMQLASLPTYILALISLIFIKSKLFTTYRIFLIWHVVENFFFEIYSAFLVEPVLHAPYPLIRTSGILSRMGVGSLYQAFMMAFAIEYNGASISEMFWFRYKASILNYNTHKFTYLLQFFVYATRLIAIFETLFPFCVVGDALDFQQEFKASLYKLNPADIFLLCDSTYVIAAFRDYVSSVILASWILQAMFFLFSIPGTAIFISFNLPKTMSDVTLKLQKQLLKSLIIQASIHGAMLGIPNIMFISAILFGYENESVAYVAIGCLTYHGFASSLALIVFTAPLRNFIVTWCKSKKKTAENKTSDNKISDKRTSAL